MTAIQAQADANATRYNVEKQSSPLQVKGIKVEGFILASLSFLVGLVGGIYLTFHLHMLSADAISRVMNSYYTLFSGKFHLAAIGFVWNPLPSLLELPLVAMRQWFPSWLTLGFAGNIISALAGGLGVYYLDDILFTIGTPRVWRLAFCLLYMVNPMIWLFNSNGMSESLMIGTLLASLSGVIRYLHSDRLSYMIQTGVWLAVGFAARYEVVPFALLLGLTLIFVLRRRGQSWRKIEANLILMGFPLIVSGVVWVLLNWTITGNPFYFFNSVYANASQLSTGNYDIHITTRDAHHLLDSVMSAAHFSFIFPPVILGLATGLLFFFRRLRFRSEYLILLAATVAIPVFQVLMLYQHASAMWSRFFIFYVPSGFLLLALVAAAIGRSKPRLLDSSFTVAAALLVLGNIMTLQNVQSPLLGRGVSEYFNSVLSGKDQSNSTYQELMSGKVIAEYINHHPNLVVLLDTFDGENIVPFIKRRQQVVITNDADFQGVLTNPRGRVTSFLVPSPLAQMGDLDAVNRQYPGIWYGKVPWAAAHAVFPGQHQFTLFNITSQAP